MNKHKYVKFDRIPLRTITNVMNAVEDGMSISQVYKKADMTWYVVGNMLSLLEDYKMIIKTRDPNNKRKVKIRLTDDGVVLRNHFQTIKKLLML